MKKLHVVGFTPDNQGLILSPRKGARSGGFMVVIDDGLVSSIEQARRLRDGEDPEETDGGPRPDGEGRGARIIRARSSLSPREIQARLRAGSSITEVADQAGVGEEWVIRFATPILAEQAQVVGRAQRLTLVKSRRGPSIEPLAPSVQWNLSDRGVQFSDDVFADNWTAYNLHGARWAVRFAYTSRKRRQVAEWEVDLRDLSLVARNRLASDLGHVEEGRRRPSIEPSDPGALESGQSSSAAREARTAAAARAFAGSHGTPTKPSSAKKRTAPGPGRRPPGRPAKATKAAKAARKGGTPVGQPRRAAAPGAVKAPAPKGSAARLAGTKATSAAPARGTGAGGRKAAPGRTVAAGRAATAAGAVKRGAAKATPARKPATGKPATGKPAARAARESSPRRASSAKKQAGDTPPGRAARSVRPGAAVTDSYTDRPSHLGRPPSPMKMANRATSYPSQGLTSTYARQAPPPPHEPVNGPSLEERGPPGAGSTPGNPRFEPGAEPRREQRATRAASVAVAEGAPAGGRAAGAAGPEARMADAAQVRPAAAPARSGHGPRAVAPPIGGRADSTPAAGVDAGQERPAVVILSTPAPSIAAGAGAGTEGRARLESAERLRASFAVPSPEGRRRSGATTGGQDTAAPAAGSRRAPRRTAGS